MNDQYTKRELDAHFTDIKGILSDIRKQTEKTNGRVSKLENWRWFITGGLGIISCVVIPLVMYIFNLQVNQVNARVSARIESTIIPNTNGK